MTQKMDPSYETVRGRVAEALAKSEKPNFSDLSEKITYEAFVPLFFDWGLSRAGEVWLATLKEEVFRISSGTVRLEDAAVHEFPVRINGQVMYLKLVNQAGERLLLISPHERVPVLVFRQKSSS